jgi:hypothetical protein
MNFTRVLIGALVIAAAIVGRESYTDTHVATVRTRVTSVHIETPAVSGMRGGAQISSGSLEPQMDLYGNQIDFAVGEYRVDGTGDLYETHSPETEVTKLGAPTT